MYPDELEHIITVEDGPKCALTDVARRPLHHAIPPHENFVDGT